MADKSKKLLAYESLHFEVWVQNRVSITCDRAFILLENSGEGSWQCPLAECLLTSTPLCPGQASPSFLHPHNLPISKSILSNTNDRIFSYEYLTQSGTAFLEEDLKTKQKKRKKRGQPPGYKRQRQNLEHRGGCKTTEKWKGTQIRKMWKLPSRALC